MNTLTYWTDRYTLLTLIRIVKEINRGILDHDLWARNLNDPVIFNEQKTIRPLCLLIGKLFSFWHWANTRASYLLVLTPRPQELDNGMDTSNEASFISVPSHVYFQTGYTSISRYQLVLRVTQWHPYHWLSHRPQSLPTTASSETCMYMIAFPKRNPLCPDLELMDSRPPYVSGDEKLWATIVRGFDTDVDHNTCSLDHHKWVSQVLTQAWHYNVPSWPTLLEK